MKFTRKLMAMVLVICLMIPYCTTMTVAADTNTQLQTAIQPKASDQPFRFGRSILEQMNNSDALLYAYDTLVEGCKSLSTSVDISHRTHRINADEATTVWQLVTNDYPLFFWLSNGVSLRGTSSSITTYGLNIPTNAQDILFALETRVAELTADLTDKSDYEKSLILHDRVANNNLYLPTNHDQTVIGSLLEGASVCAGYARAYQLLMQTVGIPCYFVTGHSKGQGHAWNLVQLDGEWYYTDVTWDDQNDNGGYIYYAYLNMTSAQMNEDHVAVEFADYLPIATATAANYHVRRDTVLDLPTAEIIATLYEASSPIRMYMSGDINAFINELNNAIYDAVGRVACPVSAYSCGYSYLGREIIINLTLTHPHNYDNNNTCTECGYKKVENHHYAVTIIQPTCGQDGYTIFKCERCGAEIRETIPATGEHVFDGNTCVDCGYTIEIVVTYGDLNDDGEINNRDLVLLQQYLNGWNVTINASAGDTNNDGEINNRDLVLLQQYLNGWDVTLG